MNGPMNGKVKTMEPVGQDNEGPIKENGGGTDKLLMLVNPLTPAPLTGNSAAFGIGKVAGYGMLSAVLWKKNRQLAYVLAGAAAISIGTSLMGMK